MNPEMASPTGLDPAIALAAQLASPEALGRTRAMRERNRSLLIEHG